MCVVCHPFPVVDIVRPSYVRVACVSEVGKEEEEERRNMEGREKRAKILATLSLDQLIPSLLAFIIEG